MSKLSTYCIITLAILAPYSANADFLDDCNSGEIEKKLGGCTVAIDRVDLGDAQRAIAYSRRSDAHLEKGEIDKAISDRLEAVKLDQRDAVLRERLSYLYLVRGQSHRQRGEYLKAIADFGLAISKDKRAC